MPKNWVAIGTVDEEVIISFVNFYNLILREVGQCCRHMLPVE